jgi:hypothetical protein
MRMRRRRRMMMMRMRMMWNGSKRMGMLGVSVRKLEALTVKMETVTLIGKVDRI